MTQAQNAAGKSTGPRKGAQLPAAAKKAAVEKGIAGDDNKQQPPVTPKEEAKHDNRFLSISTATYVEALKSSIGFSKSALQLELAVNISVFANMDNSGRDGRAEAMKIYEAAGFKVDTPKGSDYKSVRRHIQHAAELYDQIGGKKAVDGWTVATNEMQTIQAIATHLDEYSFKSFNSVLQFIDESLGKATTKKANTHGGARKKAAPAQAHKQADKTAAPTPQPRAEEPGKPADAPQAQPEQLPQTDQQPNEEDKALMAEMGVTAGHTRRREDNSEKECVIIKTANLHVAIPFGTDPQEIMELAMSMMTYVQKQGTVLGKPAAKLNS